MKDILKTQLQSWGVGHLENTILAEVKLATHRLALSLLSILFSKEEILECSYDPDSLKPLDAHKVDILISISFMRFALGVGEHRLKVEGDIMGRIKGKVRERGEEVK